MEKTGVDFDDGTEEIGFKELSDALHGRIEGKFRTAADGHFRMSFDAFHDGIVGFFVDTERFFPQQMTAGSDDVAVDLLVEVVRYGTVNGFDFRIGKELMIIVSDLFDGGEVVLIPGIESRIFVADGDQFRFCIYFSQVTPPGAGTGEFPAHKTGSDDSEFYSFHDAHTFCYIGFIAANRSI